MQALRARYKEIFKTTKGTRGFKKCDFEKRIRDHDLAAAKIQVWWRTKHSVPEMPSDAVCQFTMEPIDQKHAFLFTTNAGKAVWYDAVALAEYILKTGDLKCCISRDKFRKCDMKRLDKKVIELGYMKPSIYHQLEYLKNQRDAQKQRDDFISGIEGQICETLAVFQNMVSNLDVIDSENTESYSYQMYFARCQQEYFVNVVASLLPQIQHLFMQMKFLCTESANRSIKNLIENVKNTRGASTCEESATLVVFFQEELENMQMIM